MIHFSEHEIDQLIHDDIPSLDLTTHVLDIGNQAGSIRFIARDKTVVCGTEEAKRVCEKLGLAVDAMLPSASRIDAGETMLEAHGDAQSIHAAWRVAVNLLEYASGIATRTRKMVDKVQSVNPNTAVLTTRKTFPWAKNLVIKSIVCGGALPHRLGLSETVLIFDEHLRFMGGIDALSARIEALKARLSEKMLLAEAHSFNDALKLARAGVDMVQLDKFKLEDTRRVVEAMRAECPGVKVAAAGGVNVDNCEDYAATGIDMIVTSALYFGKPADIKADIQPAGD